jgi:hypothetical protein
MPDPRLFPFRWTVEITFVDGTKETLHGVYSFQACAAGSYEAYTEDDPETMLVYSLHQVRRIKQTDCIEVNPHAGDPRSGERATRRRPPRGSRCALGAG